MQALSASMLLCWPILLGLGTETPGNGSARDDAGTPLVVGRNDGENVHTYLGYDLPVLKAYLVEDNVLTVLPKRQESTAGTSASFNCSVVSSDPVKFSWAFERQPLSNVRIGSSLPSDSAMVVEGKVKLDGTRTLNWSKVKLHPLTESMEGHYVCSAISGNRSAHAFGDLAIIVKRLDSSCSENAECRYATPESKCLSGFCRCSEEYVRMGGACYRKVGYGEPCQFDEQCQDITWRTMCQSSRCECIEGYVYVRRTHAGRCLKPPDYESKAQEVYRVALISASCFLVAVLGIFVACVARKSFCRRNSGSDGGARNRPGGDIFSITDGIAAAMAVDKPPSYDQVIRNQMMVVGQPPPAYAEIGIPSNGLSVLPTVFPTCSVRAAAPSSPVTDSSVGSPAPRPNPSDVVLSFPPQTPPNGSEVPSLDSAMTVPPPAYFNPGSPLPDSDTAAGIPVPESPPVTRRVASVPNSSPESPDDVSRSLLRAHPELMTSRAALLENEEENHVRCCTEASGVLVRATVEIHDEPAIRAQDEAEETSRTMVRSGTGGDYDNPGFNSDA